MKRVKIQPGDMCCFGLTVVVSNPGMVLQSFHQEKNLGLSRAQVSDNMTNEISTIDINLNPKQFRRTMTKVLRIRNRRRNGVEHKRRHHKISKFVHSVRDRIIFYPTPKPDEAKQTPKIKTKNTRQTSENSLESQPGNKVSFYTHLTKFGKSGVCAYDVFHHRPKGVPNVAKKNRKNGKLNNHIPNFHNQGSHLETEETRIGTSSQDIDDKKTIAGERYVEGVEGSGTIRGDVDDDDKEGEEEELENPFVEKWETKEEFLEYGSKGNESEDEDYREMINKMENFDLEEEEGEEEGDDILPPTFFPLRQESDTTVDWLLENIPTTSMVSLLEGSSYSFLLQTTPKLGVTDDIIFSGAGAGCHSDDEDDCTSVGSGIDDIITPTVIIKTTPQPPTTTSKPHRRTGCTGRNCDRRTNGNDGIFGPTPEFNYGNNRRVTPGYGLPSSLTPTGETSKESVGAGIGATLNIGLIIGIAAGVLVALLILIFALYKFRTRSEGTYKVDESQNFSYLESKKQQGNGALLGANENSKRGKKKDVKEWYV